MVQCGNVLEIFLRGSVRSPFWVFFGACYFFRICGGLV